MKIALISLLCAIALYSNAQTADAIIKKLNDENEIVTKTPCTGGKGMIITPRALNVFFADKIGSYLSEGGDLSLFGNYATLSTSDGKFTINHNFKKSQPNGRIKNIWTIGAKANIADGFAAVFNGRKLNNELGVTVKYTYIGSGSMFFDDCMQPNRNGPGELLQKDKMDLARAYILGTLAEEIKKKAEIIDTAVSSISTDEVPGQTDLSTIKTGLSAEEYDKLEKEYLKKFATEQATKIDEVEGYNLITTWWLSLNAYLPVTTQKFSVAPNFLTNFADKTTYPFTFSLSYNRIWESRRVGRIFLNVSTGFNNNNTINTEDVEKISLNEYKNLGGTDTVHYAELSSDEAYVGSFSTFITPFVKLQGVYFPRKWNVGVSALLEQNFGEYNPLDLKVGFPIRLNDKDGDPTVNFEVQVRFTDLSKNIDPDKKLRDRTSVGISVGLPFSSILY